MKKVILLTLSALLLGSCATLFTGTKDTLTFESNPSGAEVYIDGLYVCITPCTVDVTRSISEERVEFKLDEYEIRVIELDREFNVVTILNLFTGGIIGFGIDALTGAMFKYDKKSYDIDLKKKIDGSSVIKLNTVDKTLDIIINL